MNCAAVAMARAQNMLFFTDFLVTRQRWSACHYYHSVLLLQPGPLPNIPVLHTNLWYCCFP